MNNIVLVNNKNWYQYNLEGNKLFYKGFIKDNINTFIKKIAKIKSLKEAPKYFNYLSENFAIIIVRKKEVFVATDKIRSFPLLYYYNNKSFFIFEDYQSTKKIDFDKVIDKRQLLLFSLSGYTFDEGTLHKNIKQINQGSAIHFFKGKVNKFQYYAYTKKLIKNKSLLETKLKNINEEVILKLIKSSNNKYIVIPLSAGYDSRFILSGLKKYDYKNIITFSYGRVNNREAQIAKILSRTLGVPWHFIPYTNKKLKKTRNSQEYKDYEAFSDSLTSIHFPQDFVAIKHLREKNIIPKGSIIVNGQSGDYITGNHLPKIDYKKNTTKERLINYYIFKHYKLWELYYIKNKEQLFNLIHDYAQLQMNNLCKQSLHRFYENLEFTNRQCKYVINGQRLYEFFDYEWRLPLWDSLYLDFWSSVPVEEKLNQKLYKKTLHNSNWCGVWNNIPINPKESFSLINSVLRLFFKGVFLFGGKKRWYNFERKYLNYFIDPLCSYAQWDYTKVIRDKREPFNSLSFEIDKYLKAKNIDWEGLLK